MSKTAIRRVALYARVSTTDHGQDPELQLTPMRGYAQAQGWEMVEYIDHASAGDERGRKAWRALMAAAALRKFDLLMVWKTDRAARSALQLLQDIQKLEHHGVGFRSLTQPELDTSSATGKLVLTILAAVAEMEGDLIRSRVREGMARARAKGSRIGRPSTTDSPAFLRRWDKTKAQIEAGTLSRRAAAKKLHVSQDTVRRLLAAATTE